MSIDFSSDEYRTLLDILHIADVVMTGHRKEEDKRTLRHRALIQKLYARAEGEGFGALMHKNEIIGKFIPTGEFERTSVSHSLLDDFADHLFWDQLISRLTARDAAQNAGGMERLAALSESDREAMENPIRRHYGEEFTRNGVENLALVERFSSVEGLPVRTSD